jgi:hypothetical protein
MRCVNRNIIDQPNTPLGSENTGNLLEWVKLGVQLTPAIA